MAKFKCALFSSVVILNNLDGTLSQQDAVTIVADTSMSKGFAGVTCVIDDTNHSLVRILSSTDSNIGSLKDKEFLCIINSLNPSYNGTVAQDSKLSKPIKEIELKNKLDILFYLPSYEKNFNNPYKLSDKDTVLNKNGTQNTLRDFLINNYSFDPNKIKDFSFSSNLLVRKYANKRKIIDPKKFYNSPYIPQSLKDYGTPFLDLDIAKSIYGTDLYWAIIMSMFSDFPERKWVSNILFGDPSSGKTTMIETICALNNLPFCKLTGDPTISMTKLIMTVGPENIGKNLTRQDYIDKCKSLGMSDSDINSISDKINELVVAQKEVDIQLTEQESLILLCIKYHLPLVVLLDEVNLFTTLLMATLADVITSGYVNVGVHTYKDVGHNIMWFGAYNPNTYKCSPFEGKFRDRALFFCSEMPSQEQLIDHKQRKVTASMFDQSISLSSIQEMIDDAKNAHPEKAAEFDAAFQLISNISTTSTPSAEALQWYASMKIDEILGVRNLSFKEGVFTNYYIDDVTIASKQDVMESVKRILILIDKVNEKLKTETVGIDTKNPDSKFYFYIPNRAIDYVISLIFCFTSVKKAFNFFIYNMIPNGGTIRYGKSKNPAKDIAELICESFSDEFDELQRFLFSNISDTEMNAALIALCSPRFNSQAWVGCFIPDENNDVSSVSSDSVTANGSSDDILDEADSLL